MTLKTTNPTKTKSWKKLQDHYKEIKDVHMKTMFSNHPERAELLSLEWEDFYLDYSKHRIDQKTIQFLTELANEVDLSDAIEKYFSGAVINKTENRAVLHTALRADKCEEVFVDGENVIPGVQEVKSKMKTFCNEVINCILKGYTGKPFKTIVNVGIGGSDLGPAMVVDALSYYKNHLKTYFVSNVDGDHVNEIIKNLDPETTLFVVVSKTFTTQETLSNATTLKNWFLNNAPNDAIASHFVAVSTNLEKVTAFGIDKQNIFPMKDWVGGRFSLWSAVGLSISLSLGYDNYEALLQGANAMDKHFRTADFDKNIPIITALLSVWYNNFFNAESEAVLPYSHYLNQFATYLQQGIMESNGKSTDREGNALDYQSGTVIWGEPGTNSQHAFFQLIHQGTKLIPAEFIGFAKSLHGNQDHQDKLMSNFFAQTEALLNGKTSDQVKLELAQKDLLDIEKNTLEPFKVFEGNKPTTTLLIDKLSPASLGKLIAMYEHRIFVQGVIWNIYSYDQFGVELGKELAGKILEEFSDQSLKVNHDSSTSRLISKYLIKR